MFSGPRRAGSPPKHNKRDAEKLLAEEGTDCDNPSTAKEDDCNANSAEKGTGSERENVEIDIDEISNKVLNCLLECLE